MCLSLAGYQHARVNRQCLDLNSFALPTPQECLCYKSRETSRKIWEPQPGRGTYPQSPCHFNISLDLPDHPPSTTGFSPWNSLEGGKKKPCGEMPHHWIGSWWQLSQEFPLGISCCLSYSEEKGHRLSCCLTWSMTQKNKQGRDGINPHIIF